MRASMGGFGGAAAAAAVAASARLRRICFPATANEVVATIAPYLAGECLFNAPSKEVPSLQRQWR